MYEFTFIWKICALTWICSNDRFQIGTKWKISEVSLFFVFGALSSQVTFKTIGGVEPKTTGSNGTHWNLSWGGALGLFCSDTSIIWKFVGHCHRLSVCLVDEKWCLAQFIFSSLKKQNNNKKSAHAHTQSYYYLYQSTAYYFFIYHVLPPQHIFGLVPNPFY